LAHEEWQADAMIGRLHGRLVEKQPPQIVLDVQGIGYEVSVPMSTFYNLPALGESVTLFTHLVVREDAHLLYGFGSDNERGAFRQLLKISGVGPKIALAVLSGMSVADLAQAVAGQESGRLTKIPGIGKKTAERLVLELRDKLDHARLGASPGTIDAERGDDVLNALVALGYNDREAQWAVKQLTQDLGVSESIRQALKLLSKS
jgi:holliday junction DNA helicase RuvA